MGCEGELAAGKDYHRRFLYLDRLLMAEVVSEVRKEKKRQDELKEEEIKTMKRRDNQNKLLSSTRQPDSKD